jgi:prepilin-type N-terminal cleavage/methylation domain-containing protein
MTMHDTKKTKPYISMRRSGFSLLELMLSLALIVVITSLIGSLMQIYARNFATRGDDIRREQLARALLSMMAEDIRSVVMQQEYDPKVLQQLLGASSSGAGASAPAEPVVSELGSSPSTQIDVSSATAGSFSTMATTSLAPGIYGDQFSLVVDVSRIPRPDEYLIQQASLIDGFLTDVPGDMKTVTYYVQASTNMGISDQLSSFADPANSTGYSSGLVRRQLDRAVTANAEEMGDSQRLLRTGDLVAPEVIAIDFAYFDGVSWLLEWDSSAQSLPWLVQISLAMQSATASQQAEWEPGTPISTMTLQDRQAYGIEVYQLIVAIPGAQLAAADAAAAEQAAGMESMGL